MKDNTLLFEVKGQYIVRLDSIEPVAKCRNLYKAQFQFKTDEWTGTKTALFVQGKHSKSVILDENGVCEIPWEFFDSDNTTFGYVSVYCGDLVTANRVVVDIVKSGYQDSDASVPPSPDVYQQLIELAEDTKKIAQSVRDDADAGKFDGEEGYSPKVLLTEELDGVTVTVQNKDVQQSAKVKNGKDGKPGKNGDPGADGITPHIGENGNWHIGDTDTGKPSRGLRGENATDKQVRTAVDAYMEENPVAITVDPTLAQEGQAADAKATGDKILQFTIKNTASGESIVLTDGAEEKLLDFGMQGKTEQASTEGKNLFDANGIDATRHILGDLSGFSDIDVGSYNLSNLIPVKEGENIVKSGTTGSSVVGFLGEDKSFLKGVSITDGKPVAVPAGAFYFCCNIAVANLKNKIQIEKGNTATPYEPYTGAKPSPSPAYPQEIVSAAENGKIEVQVNGKNLLEGLEFGSIDNQGNIIQSTTAYININKFIEVKEGKHVINSRDEKRFLCAIFLYDKDKQFIRLDQSGDCVVRKGEKYINITSAKSLVDGVDKTQIELTDRSINPTAYEPYKGLQKVQFQLDRPLTKWDRLEKREGVWGIARQSVREELTQYNFDTYILPSGSYPTGVYCYATKKSNAVLENQSSFCTHFKNSNYAYSITNAKVGIYSDHGKVQYKYFVSDKPTVDEFKTWLVQQKEAGTPVELVYKTAEETWEPLPEETQLALNNLHTNYPTTIISNSEDCEMEVTYVCDTKTYIDNKFKELQQATISTNLEMLERRYEVIL